jgi:hypothetical protein
MNKRHKSHFSVAAIKFLMHQREPAVLINPLNAELNPICHLLALLGSATIVVVSRLRVKKSTHTHISEKETGGREGHRLRVFEYRVLREMCKYKWKDITGDWTE